METCPYCAGKIVNQCKCKLGDAQCENGHYWHRCPTHHCLVEGDSDHTASNECSCYQIYLPGFWLQATERHHIWKVFKLPKDAPIEAYKASKKPEGAQAIGHIIVLNNQTILAAPAISANKLDAIRLLQNPSPLTSKRELTEEEKEIVIPEGVTKTVNFFYESRDHHTWPGRDPEPCDTWKYTGPVTRKELDDDAYELAENENELQSWWEFEGEKSDDWQPEEK